MVAMNPQTWDKDVAEIEPGGYLFYDSTKPLPPSKFRDDINVIGMPLTEICNADLHRPARSASCSRTSSTSARCRRCSDIEPEVIEKLFGEQYKGKEKLLESEPARRCSWAATTRSEHLDDARSACACERARRASATASSSTATPRRRSAASTAAPRSAPGIRSRRRRRSPRRSRSTARKLRVDTATGKNKFAIVQAEDELASIGIVDRRRLERRARLHRDLRARASR